MIDFFDIIKDTAAYRQLMNDVKNNSVAHAYLIECGDILLLKSFAAICSAIIVCPNSGCFNCKSCKKALSGYHQDILSHPKGKNMSVADVAEIINECSLMTVEGGARAIFIDCSGIINDDWQNKLLKILEEPPLGTYFFLSAPSHDNLLPTIVSRTRRIRLQCTNPAVIANELIGRKVDRETAEMIAKLSMSSITQAIKLSTDEYLEMVEQAEAFFAKVKNSKQALPYVKEFEKYKDKASELLELMVIILFNTMKNGGNDDYSIEACAVAIEKISEAKNKLNSYCNFTIVLDNLIMQILEVKYKCRRL